MNGSLPPPVWSYGLAPHAVSVLVIPPTIEPLTIAEAKLRAGLDWADGDPRDALMTDFIAAARGTVEQRTGLALFTQTRDVLLDTFPADGQPVQLPALSMPLQSVESIGVIDAAGVTTTLDPASYIVDTASGRIGLPWGYRWPQTTRRFQPIAIRLIAGWGSVALFTAAAPLLLHAVGLLVAHYATAGRDLTSGTIITTTPQGFEEALGPYLPETLA